MVGSMHLYNLVGYFDMLQIKRKETRFETWWTEFAGDVSLTAMYF